MHGGYVLVSIQQIRVKVVSCRQCVYCPTLLLLVLAS